MNFNDHSNLKDCHAFLSASKHSWINYDVNKLETSFLNHLAKQKGTILHELAADLISMRIKLADENKTFNMYVNDAIGYNMVPEQTLYYSDNCFGTADTIAFYERKSLLRIHDLKTGVTPASMDQLKIYAALFCLEYDVHPNDIDMELRLYQFDKIIYDDPQREDIMFIERQIIEFDKVINQMKEEEL